MAVLLPNEYDAYYFDGKHQTYSHNAGYGDYNIVNNRQFAAGGGFTLEESTGNRVYDMCMDTNIKLNGRFIGKKLLVLGTAYGFEVEGFRALGIDAWGVEVSPFAISQASPEVQPYLIEADARTYLPTLRKFEYDYIYSRWFLECMSDADLAALIPAMNNVAKNEQLHIMSSHSPVDYYNVKTLEEWAQLDFNVGTILVVNDDFDNYLTKINQ